MIQQYCTVCSQPVTEPKQFEGRIYCEEHLNTFSLNMPGVWQALNGSVALLILQVIAVGAASLILPASLGVRSRNAISLSLVLLPPLVWLITLYRGARRSQDEISPLLPTILVFAALLAAAFARPFLYEFINVDVWLTRTTPVNRFLGNVLVVGATHALLLFALIRFTVWHTPTFLRRIDGIMFGLAAGWGYGTTFGVLTILNQPGLMVLNGGLRLITQICPYVVLGLVIGYTLGRSRFEVMPVYFMALGVLSSAVLYGLLAYAGTELNSIRLNLTTDGFSPWPGIVVNLLALGLISAAVFGLQTRHNRLTRARLRLEED